MIYLKSLGNVRSCFINLHLLNSKNTPTEITRTLRIGASPKNHSPTPIMAPEAKDFPSCIASTAFSIFQAKNAIKLIADDAIARVHFAIDIEPV